MDDVEHMEWWKAREMPLLETDWRNIKLYCESDENPFEWERCVYVIRLAPPFCIAYGEGTKIIESPLIYVGSGALNQRWSYHREWLYELGHTIPGGRYEVWVCRPKCRKNPSFYEQIEADILDYFRTNTDYLPLRNLKLEGNTGRHTYVDGFFNEIIKPDRRYSWAIYPRIGQIREYYEKGS